jgi:hypothetical protein
MDGCFIKCSNNEVVPDFAVPIIKKSGRVWNEEVSLENI